VSPENEAQLFFAQARKMRVGEEEELAELSMAAEQNIQVLGSSRRADKENVPVEESAPSKDELPQAKKGKTVR
jgi:hypothetical protein